MTGDALQFEGMDGRRLHDGMPFSTPDRDNDAWAGGSCAQVTTASETRFHLSMHQLNLVSFLHGQLYESGWWFNLCYWANLNGVYRRSRLDPAYCLDGKCMAWRTIPDYEDYSLKKTVMKIRPNPRTPEQ